MASSVATDLTTCPICLEVFDNPKSLPCLHAFCLKCLQGYFNDKCPGDKAPCPLCRKEFQIPSDGLAGLQHNFIIQKLIDNRKATNEQLQAGSCDKHGDKQVELYCQQCNENVCVLCYATKHRNHESGEIPEVAERLKPKIDRDDRQIVSAINTLSNQLEYTKQDVDKFCSDVDNVEKMVLETGVAEKRAVDNQISELVTELQSMKSDNAKQAQAVQYRRQQALVAMESFHTYCRELLDKGRPSDVTRAASALHDRATELLQNDVTTLNFRPPHVTFTPADVTQLTRLNLVGKVSVGSEKQTGKLQSK